MRGRLRSRLKAQLIDKLNVLKEAMFFALRLDVDEEMHVDVAGRIPVQTRISQDIVVDIDEGFDAVATLDEPAVDIPLDERITVPVELDLRIPLDAQVWVEETIRFETTVAIDTTVTAMGFAPIPVKADIPVSIEAPIRQAFHIEAELEVPVRETLQVPIRHTASVPLAMQLPISVRVSDRLPVKLDVALDSAVDVEQRLPVRLRDSIVITKDELSFGA